jgi:hypothetical protein
MQGSNRWADKSTSFHATTKSATSGFTSPALADHLGVKRKLQVAAIQQTFYSVAFALKSCLAEKKQDRTEKRNQNPSCVCLGNNRNLLVSLMLVVVAYPMMLVVVAPRMVDPIVIVVGICERGQDEGGGY